MMHKNPVRSKIAVRKKKILKAALPKSIPLLGKKMTN